MTLRARARVATWLALLALPLLAGVSPAWGHTSLVTSTPAPAERLDRAPDVITLQFNAVVAADADSVEVRDGRGQNRVTDVLVSHDGRVVSAILRPNASEGGWRVSYRVRGGDGHVVEGGVDFVVGDGSLVGGGPLDPWVAGGSVAALALLAFALLSRRVIADVLP